ncbi:MAG: hypothetical protein IJD96_06560, partial [Lachnospiraceae bacterium]|nr:hypothetical protein [Lachnospiraceae bacterium]
MKKLMKKGSLLIVWSLLLAMMFGMSVHAMKYGVTHDYYYPTGGGITWSFGQSGTVTLYDGDIIGSTGPYTIIVDGVSDIVEIGGETSRAEWTYRGDPQEFAWNLSSYDNNVTVMLTSISAPGEPAPAPGEPAPEKEEDKHEHNWEWIQIQAATDAQDGVEAMCCTECGQQGESRTIVSSAYGVFCGETKDKITGAAENATVEMETEIWSSLPKSVMDAIK